MYRSEKALSGTAHPRQNTGGEKDGFRPDIEGLRGIAVALVVMPTALALLVRDVRRMRLE